MTRDENHDWKECGGYKCSKCDAFRNLTGRTVVAASYSLVEPYRSASEWDRSFFCVSKASLGNKVYEGLYDGFWLIDGTKGSTAFFVIEKVLDETPAWVVEKYPRVAHLARSKSRGQFTEEGTSAKVTAILSAANAGDVDAQISAGMMYTEGIDVQKDLNKARQWYLEAANQGNAEAQCNVGALFADGMGVSRDPVAALRWYRKSAEQGYARAMYNLGSMYARGEGLSRDYIEAEKWIRLAAEAGFAQAQYNLGVMLLKGIGARQDAREAAKWLGQAADQGEAQAQYNLGLMFAVGEGVEQNLSTARIWLTKASEKGHREAMNTLKKLESLPQNRDVLG